MVMHLQAAAGAWWVGLSELRTHWWPTDRIARRINAKLADAIGQTFFLFFTILCFLCSCALFSLDSCKHPVDLEDLFVLMRWFEIVVFDTLLTRYKTPYLIRRSFLPIYNRHLLVWSISQVSRVGRTMQLIRCGVAERFSHAVSWGFLAWNLAISQPVSTIDIDITKYICIWSRRSLGRCRYCEYTTLIERFRSRHGNPSDHPWMNGIDCWNKLDR